MKRTLAERATKEADDIMSILTELQRAIQEQLDDPFFHSRPQHRDPGKSDPVTFTEEQEMAMLYGGGIDSQPVGVTLMPDPKNFRRSWFNARDYGVLVANPFGQNSFTKGEKSKVVVQKGETFRLRFGVLVHSGKADVAAAYKEWVATLPYEKRSNTITK